jgi:Tfp pilus assembly protein PilX
MGKKHILENEEGSVIVLAVIMLALLTLLGIAVTTTSSIEVQIAGNEHKYKKELYLAEGAAMQCAQILEDQNNAQELHPTSTTLYNSWLKDNSVEMSDPDIMLVNSQQSTIDPDNNTRYGAVCLGIGSGDSLDMSAPSSMHEYAIFGLYSGVGQHQIRVGYKKRF